jgi:CMP-N-acetylneuraminic acid synthetase
VTESTESPFWTFIVQNGFLTPLIETKQFVYQRQLLPKTYILNGAIYIRNVKDFVKTKQLIPEDSMPFIMDLQSSADIDSLEDLKSVEKFLKYHFPAK